jgi:hypothetical protein
VGTQLGEGCIPRERRVACRPRARLLEG